jgi:uncharacterized membrane protein
MRVVRAGLAALLIVLAVVAPVTAQGPLELTSPFPAVVADPGATATFNVTVTTDVPQRVDLAVTAQPDGWDTTLRGGGSTIAAVFTSADPELGGQIGARFTAEVLVADDAAADANQVVLEARGTGGVTARLALDITIEQQEAGAVTLESDFPTQGGSSDDTFTFDLELRNRSNQQVELSFEADAPPGWRAQVRPAGGESATTAVLDAGEISSATVTITPAADAAAGTYTIPVRAIGGPEPAEAAVSIEITGSYAMQLTTQDNRLSARITAGNPSPLTLFVFNEGSAPLENVAVSANAPRDWTVEFDQETVPLIEPQGQAEVQATITASGNAIAGDYVVTFNARAPEANDQIEVRTTVETSPIGGILGLGILAVVAIGLFLVFQRYGRR